jgi:geranylgeranyl pyrophosphate synthase
MERHLGGVLDDTLGQPGSLARALLTYALSAAWGHEPEAARDLGVAVEYFHTASLLFDDLPCMDDATTRRGQLCAHRVHGEAAAILGALALINQGYAMLWRVLGARPAGPRERAAALVAECLGAQGILNGQALDLHFAESARGKAEVFRIARGKTVTLIRLTLLLPARVEGVAAETEEQLERLSDAWGLAYQILDDFKDVWMAPGESGKTAARDHALQHPNLPLAVGKRVAAAELERQLAMARGLLDDLGRQLPDVAVLNRLQAMLETNWADLRQRAAASSQAVVPV